MKRHITLMMVAMLCLLQVHGYELPQFSSKSFEGWTYNSSSYELSTRNIMNGNISLYISSSGKVVDLTSPDFDCTGLDSIAVAVKWKMVQFQYYTFVLENCSLTVAVQDTAGNTLDSATVVPQKLTNIDTLHLTVPVPKDLTTARLRLVSWTGDINSSGAVIFATTTAIENGSSEDVQRGDVNGDGIVDISDVTALIDLILNGDITAEDSPAADVNVDNVVDISDVTALIDKILG